MPCWPDESPCRLPSPRLLGHPHNLAGSAGTSPRREKKCLPSSPATESPRQRASVPGAPGLEEQKASLQVLVMEFAERAVRGCLCTCLVESPFGTARAAAEYFLDASLRWLTIAPPGDGPGRARCPLAQLKDILYDAKHGQAFVGPEVAFVLEPGEAELVLALTFRGAEGPRSRILLLMESPERRDAFLESMQVLSVYAQSQLDEPDY